MTCLNSGVDQVAERAVCVAALPAVGVGLGHHLPAQVVALAVRQGLRFLAALVQQRAQRQALAPVVAPLLGGRGVLEPRGLAQAAHALDLGVGQGREAVAGVVGEVRVLRGGGDVELVAAVGKGVLGHCSSPWVNEKPASRRVRYSGRAGVS